ncbi:terpene synthase family protein [Streptomyces chattanoogensis]|uniref:terpene synthase family protein n=1 Tax=Streptomyces chattanoogensis TaxID=66876 RepID=UPI0036941541
MSQAISLTMPLPRHSVPTELEDVRKMHLDWLHGHSLLASGADTEQYVRSRVADIAAYTDPCSRDMLLSYNVTGWIFLHDDWMDTSAADRMADHAVTAELISILHRPVTPSCPITAAFADLWEQLQGGMSEAWCQRMAWLWQEYFQENLTEAANRRGGSDLTSKQHVRVKDRAIAAYVMYAVAERTGNFEIGADVWHASYLSKLRHHATRHMVLLNEIQSFSCDEADARVNLVSLVAQERNLTVPQALEEVSRDAEWHVRQLCTLSTELSSFCDGLQLSAKTRENITQHLDSLLCWVRGSYDWYDITCRYSLAESR